jgi:hypothetical protein
MNTSEAVPPHGFELLIQALAGSPDDASFNSMREK